MDTFPAGLEVAQKRKSAFKLELIWASILFALMFVTVLALGSVILMKDLGDKEVFRMLSTYSKDLENQLKQLPSTETMKGYRQQKTIVTRLNLFLTEKRIFDSWKLYDEQGRLVQSKDDLIGGALVEGDPPEDLLPGQQSVTFSKKIPVVVNVPIEHGKMGKAIFSVSQDVLQRQAQDFRHEMMLKVLIMVGTISVLLMLAFLYVLRLLRVSRKIEFEAQSQERLSYLGLLSSGMAHEIKNPLNSIQMNLQLLEEEASGTQGPLDISQWVEPIRKEIRRLEQLVNDFLLYARPINPDRKPFEVEPFLGSLATFLSGEASKGSVKIEMDIEPGLPPVTADEGLIRTALMNLMLNAIQSMSTGGTVKISARKVEKMLKIEIADSGAGIPKDKQEKVFQIFFTTKPGGTGLGLPIARRIAESHGGTLSIVTPGDDPAASGVTMRLEIPLS